MFYINSDKSCLKQDSLALSSDRFNIFQTTFSSFFPLLQTYEEARYNVVGFYFKSKLEEALNRNAQRKGKEKIPEVGIRSTYKKLELPSKSEGFDKLFYVEIVNNVFVVKKWKNEV